MPSSDEHFDATLDYFSKNAAAPQRKIAEEFVQEVVDRTDNNGELDPYRKECLTNQLVALLNSERADERSRLARIAKHVHITEFIPNVAGTQTVQDRVAEWIIKEAQ